MISEIIDYINTFIVIPSANINGLAQLVIRNPGDNQQQLPGLIHNEGEVTYVGIDDKHPLILYHINNSISSDITTTSYGNNRIIKNTFNNTMYVYYDRKRINLMPDDIYLYIQSVVPESINEIGAYIAFPFKTVFVKFNNVILSSLQVFASQYQGTGYRLHPEKHLFAINYIVESTLIKGCFDNPF